jgi:parallel beta-helix repeat protein
MNTNISTIIMAAMCGLLLTVSQGFSQGALTPPGAPAPTMKSLDQVEARTIVNASNTPGDASDLFIISKPGSYYLTTNLTGVSGKNGIEITTNNVTLDLNGFAVQGVSGSANGISIPIASSNVTIRNGAVSGWGLDGVFSSSSSAVNIVCERLNVFLSGVNNDFNFGDGIYLNGSGVIRDCGCQKNYINGITCPGNGFVLISGCTTGANSYGIHIQTNCAVKDCNVSGNYIGIEAGYNCTIIDCGANGNTSGGIVVVGNNCQISGNTCSGNLSYGIAIQGRQNRIDNNSVGNNTSFGIYPILMNVTNTITRNSSPGIGYGNVSGNNDYAPIQTPNTATSPWANF